MNSSLDKGITYLGETITLFDTARTLQDSIIEVTEPDPNGELILNEELDEKIASTTQGVNLLLYFICSIWICIAYVGYTLVERSATRPHNSQFVLYRNTVNMCVAYFIFYLIGFGISTEAAGGIVGNGKAYGQDFQSIDYTRWIISFGLCLISVQVQNSSMAERTHLGTHIIYSFYIAAIIYPVSASWVWGKGWLKQLGFVDFVGGGVVHMVSGFGGLVATIILEPRLEVISNLNRLQQQKLRRQVKQQVIEKKKQMKNVLSNKVNNYMDGNRGAQKKALQNQNYGQTRSKTQQQSLNQTVLTASKKMQNQDIPESLQGSPFQKNDKNQFDTPKDVGRDVSQVSTVYNINSYNNQQFGNAQKQINQQKKKNIIYENHSDNAGQQNQNLNATNQTSEFQRIPMNAALSTVDPRMQQIIAQSAQAEKFTSNSEPKNRGQGETQNDRRFGPLVKNKIGPSGFNNLDNGINYAQSDQKTVSASDNRTIKSSKVSTIQKGKQQISQQIGIQVQNQRSPNHQSNHMKSQKPALHMNTSSKQKSNNSPLQSSMAPNQLQQNNHKEFSSQNANMIDADQNGQMEYARNKYLQNTMAYKAQNENKFFKIHSKKKNIEDMLVYQALRDQKKMELMMKVRELRHVQIKEKYFDALIRLYDMNIAKYFHYNTETLPFTVLGILLIFIGNIFINMSFTQNQVSIQLNVIPQKVAMNTVLACSISGIVNCFISFRKSQTEVFDLIAGMNGLICGYVSICSCCHNVQSWSALIIGAIGSILQEFFRRTMRKFDIDDPMDSISTHGICGFWSVMALGIFDNDEGIIFTGNGKVLGIQLIGAVSLLLLSITLSLIFFYPLKRMGRVRISKIQEIIGMDIYLKQNISQSDYQKEDRIPAYVFQQIESTQFNKQQ